MEQRGRFDSHKGIVRTKTLFTQREEIPTLSGYSGRSLCLTRQQG